MKRSIQYRGFTLIELVAASALAALLMVGVLTVFTGIVKDRQRLATGQSSHSNTQRALLELIRRDLVCTTKFDMREDGILELHTYASLDSKTLEPMDRPSVVTYRIVGEGGNSILLRQQDFEDDLVEGPPLRTVAAFGVHRVEVEPLQNADGPSVTKANTGHVPGKEAEATASVRLRIGFDDSVLDIDQVLCVR